MSIDTSNRYDKKIKILFFHNTLPEYRIEWFVEMSKIVDIDFVFTNPKLNEKIYGFDINKNRIKTLSCTFLEDGISGINQLKRILEDIEKYDFVELPSLDSFREVIYGQLIVQECKKRNVKIGYFWEKWEAPKNKQPLKRKVKNMILRKIPKLIYVHADIIFIVGQKSKEYFISNGIQQEKIFFLPNTCETPVCPFFDIRKKYSITNDRKIIMFLGRLIPQKGVSYLIKSFYNLRPELRDKIHLLIVGDGVDKSVCEALVEKCKVENITFAGAVDPNIRGEYFAQCDIFVYPVTYYQGRVDVWGLTINEAVQHGKIIIATEAVGSAYELIEDGVNGFRVQPENIEELTRAIEKSLDSDLLINAKIKNRELMKLYNNKNMAKYYIESVKQCLQL